MTLSRSVDAQKLDALLMRSERIAILTLTKGKDGDRPSMGFGVQPKSLADPGC